MIRFAISALLVLSFSSPVLSQSTLPIPRNIQQTYQQGFRTYDGKPGPNYFVNQADYTIQAQVDPATSRLTGTEVIRYQNNSSKVLNRLVIHLYQNLYQPGSVLDMALTESALKEGVTITGLWFGTDTLEVSGSNSPIAISGTQMSVRLPQPLAPGTAVEVGISWEFTLPESKQLRMGKYDEDVFFFAYWYPQIAVFDEIQGWDRIPFTGLQEFYQEFGDFDVSITVPKDFIIWATGVFQNPKEVLAEPFFSRHREAQTSDEVVPIIRKEEVVTKGYTVDQDQLTWKFKADYVPDFAFGMSNTYRWDGGSVVVDSVSGRRVYVESSYPQANKHFSDITAVAKDVLTYLSTDLPGIPYPYPKISVFNGLQGGGMEYPMMANDAATTNAMYTYSLTCHEIAHTYFPFYMGLNEQKYAWIDEGLASFIPGDLLKAKGLSRNPLRYDVVQYSTIAGTETDVPLMIPSYQLRGKTYYSIVYSKAPVALAMLRDDMGAEVFQEALQEFIRRWNGKHPNPFDLFFTFDDVANENYDWFWKPWFFESGYPDLGIASLDVKDKSGKIVIEKIGTIPIPIHLIVSLGNGSNKTLHLPVSVWRDGNSTYEMKLKFEESIETVRLGHPEIPDVNPKNNVPGHNEDR